MSCIVVIQARTNSSRLPGKVLLPLGGLPVAVLAAKRAANTGKRVIVATSDEASDDALAEILLQHNIRHFRGKLDDTLDRVVGALKDYDDSTIVFRLTSDNVLPDGTLLDAMEAEYIRGKYEYLCCNGRHSGAPYGLSAEVTRLSYLRAACQSATSLHDREHVTPYIARTHGAHYFEYGTDKDLGRFRCTIDSLDDYLAMCNLFSGVQDPISESVHNLVAKLKLEPLQPLMATPVPRLVFGTAQIGGDYGVANSSGQPSTEEGLRMLKCAIANGVEYLDTARLYGNSEAVIGKLLREGWRGRVKIITKLSSMERCPDDASGDVVASFVDASLFQSLSALCSERVDVLLLHRAAHLRSWDGQAWSRLLEHQDKGRIGTLGVSVQSPAELGTVLKNPQVGHIQLPFNILDHRWTSVLPKLVEARADRNLIIHVRSVLLQGLFRSNDPALWCRAHIADHSSIRTWLEKCCETCRRSGIVDLCISYVNAMPWVDGIVIGMESLDQLVENIDLQGRPALSLHEVKAIESSRPTVKEDSLDPATWSPDDRHAST